MKNVYAFYMDCDLLPLSARVNLYDRFSKKLLLKDYQDYEHNDFDERLVYGYLWNPKTQLLKIYC